MEERESLFDAEQAALHALAGHRDDVRTVFGWMLALDGRLNTINDVIGAREMERVDVARAWDGLDNAALCDALEAAFDALDLHEKAISV